MVAVPRNCEFGHTRSYHHYCCVHRLITFTLVSDPIEGDTNAECLEFGSAEFDLRRVIKTGRDVNQEKLEGKIHWHHGEILHDFNLRVKAFMES